MAELNLRQIADKLNSEFAGEGRKLIFWYDVNGDFTEDVDTLELKNAKVYHLCQDNQFYTKYFLEYEDTVNNYLIYAPFAKPGVKDNHLEDMLLYSKRFYADRASLIVLDLKIDEKYKYVLEKYIKFFANKERSLRFYNLEIDIYDEDSIETGLICAICRSRIASFEEALRIIFNEGTLEDNKYFAEIEKYNLTAAFWRLCDKYFGFTNAEPSLEKLLISMFMTYTDRYIKGDTSASLRQYLSGKAGSIIAFLDNTMNNNIYRATYDRHSAFIAKKCNVAACLAEYPPEDLLDCDTFLCIDGIIINWLTERLLEEDTAAVLDGLTIPQVCDKRLKMHFAEQTKNIYKLLKSAYQLVLTANYRCADKFTTVFEAYQTTDWQIDYNYRHFYVNYSCIINKTEGNLLNAGFDKLEQLRVLIENIYTNEYLNKQLPAWNNTLQEEKDFKGIKLQRNFYRDYLENNKERTVVIISDALRYEVAKELFNEMQDNPKCAAKINAVLGVLPSYTRLGMAALLPHKTLSVTDNCDVLADGFMCNTLALRQNILQSYCPASVCLQYDDIKNLKKDELREIFTGKQIIYIYHNQIDARGDKQITEDEVFDACNEAIKEIKDFINRISINANTYNFIVTADHGFIYKRNKLSESDKITVVNNSSASINRRFIIANEPVNQVGVHSLSLGYILNNGDNKFVSYPVSSNVFKVAGGGQNYVHGGSSPQEMLVPVIEIKMDRYHVDTHPASIALVSSLNKITNLITAIDFFQTEAVSDTVKAANYKLYFITDNGDKISNENIFIADSREQDPAKRIMRMNFRFKNQKYDKAKHYYLVVHDDENDFEVWRKSVIMDLAFTDDFGF